MASWVDDNLVVGLDSPGRATVFMDVAAAPDDPDAGWSDLVGLHPRAIADRHLRAVAAASRLQPSSAWDSDRIRSAPGVPRPGAARQRELADECW